MDMNLEESDMAKVGTVELPMAISIAGTIVGEGTIDVEVTIAPVVSKPPEIAECKVTISESAAKDALVRSMRLAADRLEAESGPHRASIHV